MATPLSSDVETDSHMWAVNFHDGSPAGAASNAMLMFAACLGARPQSEIYLSTPITTGPAFIRWRERSRGRPARDDPEYAELHRRHVVNANLARTAPLVAELRDLYTDQLVINPAALPNLSGWTQGDYHEFWCAIIERYAATVIFSDGWQFSRGCVAEFLAAYRLSLIILNQDLTPMTTSKSISLLQSAVTDLERVGEETGWLMGAIETLGAR